MCDCSVCESVIDQNVSFYRRCWFRYTKKKNNLVFLGFPRKTSLKGHNWEFSGNKNLKSAQIPPKWLDIHNSHFWILTCFTEINQILTKFSGNFPGYDLSIRNLWENPEKPGYFFSQCRSTKGIPIGLNPVVSPINHARRRHGTAQLKQCWRSSDTPGQVDGLAHRTRSAATAVGHWQDRVTACWQVTVLLCRCDAWLAPRVRPAR